MRLFRYCLVALVLAAAPGQAQSLFTEDSESVLATDLNSAYGAAWADLNGDLAPDLFVPQFFGTFPSDLYLGGGDGTFVHDTGNPIVNGSSLNRLGVCFADFDNDGDLDLASAGEPRSYVYRNDGNAQFTELTTDELGDGDEDPTPNAGWACAWGDYDRDGFADLFITHPAGFVAGGPLPNSLYHNDGDGTFTRITDLAPTNDGLAPYTVGSWTDFDLDGDLDLFIGAGPAQGPGSNGPDFLYRNLLAESGTATFERITDGPLADATGRSGQVWNFVDYDHDGDLDGFVTNWDLFNNQLYRNDGGTYTLLADHPLGERAARSLGQAWADFDNDGDLDVFVVNFSQSGSTPHDLFLNSGAADFTFTRDATFDATPGRAFGAAVADHDLDGDLDLYVPNVSATNGQNKFYRNDADALGNGWLKLRLVGTDSDRTAIGAQVRATATIGGIEQTQFREVSTQNTFNGHHDLIVHFGLGDADAVTTLEITWPSGTVDTFEDVPRDVYFEVTEGEGLVAVANEPGEAATPETIGLTAAYPNPFAETATIRYTVPAGPVRLVVFDVLGRRVRTLADRVHSAGTHTATWDGTDGTGRTLSAGVYLYRLEAGGETLSRSLTLLR